MLLELSLGPEVVSPPDKFDEEISFAEADEDDVMSVVVLESVKEDADDGVLEDEALDEFESELLRS